MALQIILAAEALGALIARVGFLVGFGGHVDYLWDWDRSLAGCYGEGIGISPRSRQKEDCSYSRVVRQRILAALCCGGKLRREMEGEEGLTYKSQ